MKKFTVKDFIAYNNPCFSCNDKIYLKIGVANSIYWEDTIYLTPFVNTENILIDLKTSYYSTLWIKITPNTNKFQTSNSNDLNKYLKKHNIFIISYCKHCGTAIESDYLNFNSSKEFVFPININRETLIVTDKINQYQIHSSFFEEKSTVIVQKLNFSNFDPITIDLPLLPKYKFKNKEHFLNKIKTYIVFS